MSDLYALLRAGKFYNAQHEKSDLHIQAASRIEALEAENRRMREALADAVEKYGKPGGPWNVPSEPGSWIVKARAALEGEKP